MFNLSQVFDQFFMYSIRIPFKITLVNDKFGSKFHLLRQMIYRYTPRKKNVLGGHEKLCSL